VRPLFKFVTTVNLKQYSRNLQVHIRITHRSKSRVPPDPPQQTPLLGDAPTLVGSAVEKAGLGLGGSAHVAVGILGSRLTGLVRERFIAHYFGLETIVADAFRAAIRIPNLLSNLFGEGVLSASFVTVYSKLRALEKDEDAENLAAAVFGILCLVCSSLVVLGVLLTPLLIDLIAPGFKGEKRALTIHIVRILFPATGLLVMSAWCLGVLNSHRRFLVSYLAPVALNATVIAALISFGRTPQAHLVIDAAWGYVLGSALQFFVQVPKVLQVLPSFWPTLQWHSPQVRAVLRNFGPIFLSRGVVQISAYIDSMIASWLPRGAVAALGSAQVISVLPISLFSMSVSAAELPALSSAVGSREEVAAFLRGRLSAGLRRIAFFIIPSAVAFLVLGDVLGGALYQTGQFRHSDTIYLWSVLAGSAVGLLATSLGRLYSSAFYALLDTRTPLRFAVIRVVLTTALGLLFAFEVPRWFGIDQKWGVAGLTASAGIAGWVEFALLRHALNQRIGETGLPADFTTKLWSIAFSGAALGYLVKRDLGTGHPILSAMVVLPLYALMYFGGSMLAGVEEPMLAVQSVLGRFRRA
jgi:putative peptidoglycan lipid II flippase